MERKAFLLKIKESNGSSVTETLNSLKELVSHLANKINTAKNFSLWNIEDLVFGYYEAESNIDDNTIKSFFEEELSSKAYFIASPGNMRLMYSAIGIPREDKNKVRHRVFLTRLKAGCLEEYKKRHDAITPKAGQKIERSHTNNFTIWNAGDMICGYAEIDIEHIHSLTDEEKEEEYKWETRMLEIMDWLTDDVDHISKEKHGKIKLVASLP